MASEKYCEHGKHKHYEVCDLCPKTVSDVIAAWRAAELADWQRMRNEMRDVAFANKERAEKAEARVQALETALRDCWEDLTHCTPQGRRTWERAKALTPSETPAEPGRECGACGHWIPEGGSNSCSLDHQPKGNDIE